MGDKYKSCTYHINGLHCSACELLVTKELEEMTQVEDVEVSFAKKTVTIKQNKNSKNSIDDYNLQLKKSGYRLEKESAKKRIWSRYTALKAALVLIILALFYWFIEAQTGNQLSISNNSSLLSFFTFGLLAGISSCAALIGGLLLSLSKQWNDLYQNSVVTKQSTPFILFNIGRLLSYALFGGLLGLIGGALQFSLGLSSVFVLFISLIMIIIGLQMLGLPWVSYIRLKLPSFILDRISSVESFQGKYMPFIAGAATFFLPCGFTLLVQAIALTTGSFTTSALIMFMFALGTLPPLVAISFSSIKFQNNPIFSSTFNLVTGLLIVMFGFYNINSQLLVLGLPNVSSITAQTSVTNTLMLDAQGLGSEYVIENNKEIQKAYMKASHFEYFPKVINLKANRATTLNIKTYNVEGCAKAMSLHGLYDEVVYLNQPTISISFVPKKGKYYISCTMGMVKPILINVF